MGTELHQALVTHFEKLGTPGHPFIAERGMANNYADHAFDFVHAYVEAQKARSRHGALSYATSALAANGLDGHPAWELLAKEAGQASVAAAEATLRFAHLLDADGKLAQVDLQFEPGSEAWIARREARRAQAHDRENPERG